MTPNPFTFTFWGVRGSTSAPNEKMIRYGGNTTCVEIEFSPGRRLIIDCGTGIRWLGHQLAIQSALSRLDIDILLTHYHRDHLDGLPFFEPLHDRDCTITFHGFPWEQMGVEEILEGAWSPPWFPFSLRDTQAAKQFVDLDRRPFDIGPLTVSTARLRHPLGVTAYRLEHPGGSVVFATDTETGHATTDHALAALARKAGTLIHDAQTTPEELEARRGHGHSTWEQAARTAAEANVGRLILFHHGPNRTDDEIDRIVEQARKLFPNTDAAREGDSFTF